MKKCLVIFTLILLVLFSIFVGVKDLSLTSWNEENWFLFSTVRLPRTLSLILAGGILAVSGLVMQQLTQNKFLTPSTIGTADSARVGMLVVMLFFPQANVLLRSTIAFLFALCGTLMFFFLLRLFPEQDMTSMALVGLMFGNVIGAITTFFAYQLNLVQNISSWLQGNFSLVMKNSYELLYLTIPLAFLLYFFAQQFTLIALGDMQAKSLGVSVEVIRFLGVALIALAYATVLVSVGNIPFLSVVIPNLILLRLGDNLRKNLLPTAITGAIFLLFCDILSRVVIAPYEMNVSIISGIIGGVIFITLLIRESVVKS
ncbi:iron complex transport system permease protein [Pilibacter termitis]|uniref:Iron complex transport system permease protein n=1 Tax=Pilibacter termitis TaxID=263852 RepID=A0A1T4NR47_9ENTE|nr:iron chelate uptake ABC transporter family permease subunit [Pilibacter termitis]SJZ81699.1 iron complex transport system permease protein [Pilibacter termitis]